MLFLAQSILKLNILPPFVESSTVVASVSRLKAKVLSIVSPGIDNNHVYFRALVALLRALAMFCILCNHIFIHM